MAINWKKNFSSTILARGKSYFKSGNVGEIKRDGNIYSSVVHGTETYKVKVNLGVDATGYSCTCPYFGTDNCKHLAAMLYKMEASGLLSEVDNENSSGTENNSNESEEKSNEKCNPFKNFLSPDDGYHYFDMEVMTKELSFSKKNVVAARKLVDGGKVSFENISFYEGYGYNSEDHQIGGRADAVVTEGNRKIDVRLQFWRNTFNSVKCHSCDSTYSFYSYKTLCTHASAALLVLGEKLKRENPGDETDSSALELLNAYRKQNKFGMVVDGRSEQKNTAMQITLVPRMEVEYNIFFLGFKIGSKKPYVVKNLYDMVEAVNKKTPWVLGKECTLDFSSDYFNDSSQKIFDLVEGVVKSEKSVGSYSSYYKNDSIVSEAKKGRLVVYGKNLDIVFDMFNGKKILAKGVSTTKNETEVLFTERNPVVKIKLSVKSGKFGIEKITAKTTLPKIIYGANANYFFEKDRFCRISADFSEKINVLSRIAEAKTDFSFSVGRKQLSEFSNRLLPWLKEFADVDDSALGEFRDTLPPEVRFKFYFDRVDDFVYAQIEACYNERVFNTTDFIAILDESGQKTVVDSKPIDDIRDTAREMQLLDIMRDYFDQFDNATARLCTSDEDKIFDLLNTGLSRLMEIGEVNTTENFLRLKIHQKTKVSIGVSVQSNLLDLEINSDGHTREELLEILDGMRKKKKFIRLRNGDFVNTQDETLEELSEMMEALHISVKDFTKGKMHIPSYRTLYLDKMLEGNSALYSNRDKNFRKLVKEFKTVDDSDFEIPQSLSEVMRPYQVFGYKWFRTLEAYGFGGILADDMGLGKTLQTISLLLSEKENASLNNEHGKNGKKDTDAIPAIQSGDDGDSEELAEKPVGTSLIVCPASLVYNWKEEFKKFAPSMNVAVISGVQKERMELISKILDFDVAVTSYDLLKRDIDKYEGIDFLFQVIDEAQFIKNSGTAAAKAVKAITARHKFALTGTPIENRLSELWSIFDFLMPGFLYGGDTFRKDFENPIVRNQDERAMERLKKMVSPFILRRLKGDVLKDLPDKIEEIRYAAFGSEQQTLYNAQAEKIRQLVETQNEENFNKGKIQILAELTKIRQICCDPNLLFEDYTGESAKRLACIDLVKSGIDGGHKILLFSQFTSMLELLENDFNAEKIPYFKITGETPKETRVELVKKFNGDDTPVFLISLKAGGTGLNLTGADIVIHYDPWWNLAVQNQATDRAHRIGQTKIVSVFKLIAKDSIEEKIVELQNTKKDLADNILSGETGGIASMSKEDILALL